MTAITVERAILEQSLEALIFEHGGEPLPTLTQSAIQALRAAIAAPATALVVTKNESGQIVAVTRQDEDGRIVEVLAESATATAPEFPTNWAQMLHYPQCWDTAAYPELRDAIHEALAWSGCSVCEPANAPTQPAWHDAPTCAGLWMRIGRISGDVALIRHLESDDIWYEGYRWFGPIPEDKK